MKLKEILYDCYNFVICRKKREGGFAATELLPATVEDTYYALKIIENLRNLNLNIDYNPQKDEALIAWLSQNKEWKEPKVFYQFLRISIMCNFKIEKKFIIQYLNNRGSRIITLERMFYLTKISELVNFSPLYIKKLPLPKIAKDWWMFIYLVGKGIIKQRLEKQKIIEYFRNCQNPDGGFGFFPGTTSYMDNTYFCLKALKFLGSKPKEPEEALNFILFCQKESGGFARTPGAAAFLESTFYAIESLQILWSLENASK